jgi:hypothetical protein
MRSTGKIAAFLFLASAPLAAFVPVGQDSDADRLLKSNRPTQNYDREGVKRELTETMEIIASLAVQLRSASPDDQKEVWDSGTRDFKLDKDEVSDSREACELLLKADTLDSALDKEKEAAKKLAVDSRETLKTQKEIGKKENEIEEMREDARKVMFGHHKKKSEAYIRDLRNWLTVSEGSLRKANEKKAAVK